MWLREANIPSSPYLSRFFLTMSPHRTIHSQTPSNHPDVLPLNIPNPPTHQPTVFSLSTCSVCRWICQICFKAATPRMHCTVPNNTTEPATNPPTLRQPAKPSEPSSSLDTLEIPSHNPFFVLDPLSSLPLSRHPVSTHHPQPPASSTDQQAIRAQGERERRER